MVVIPQLHSSGRFILSGFLSCFWFLDGFFLCILDLFKKGTTIGSESSAFFLFHINLVLLKVKRTGFIFLTIFLA